MSSNTNSKVRVQINMPKALDDKFFGGHHTKTRDHNPNIHRSLKAEDVATGKFNIQYATGTWQVTTNAKGEHWVTKNLVSPAVKGKDVNFNGKPGSIGHDHRRTNWAKVEVNTTMQDVAKRLKAAGKAATTVGKAKAKAKAKPASAKPARAAKGKAAQKLAANANG
jgi:hypothetical protein